MASPDNTTSGQHYPSGMLLHPQTNQLGGETFAPALMLSLSCAPLLKRQLLRNLQMTDEEFASLEPVIAQAYNNWNHQRQLHAAQSSSDATTEGQHSPHMLVDHELSFPQPQLGGHMFASTLLQCFSCAPLLKQQTLRSLQMTNEELNSIAPVIAEVYDSWDYQRGLHSAQGSADVAQSSDIQPGFQSDFALAARGISSDTLSTLPAGNLAYQEPGAGSFQTRFKHEDL